MNGTSTLEDPQVAGTLRHMFERADRDDETQARIAEEHPDGFAGSSAKEKADANAGVYMPISRDAGRLLYNLVRATTPQTVVEFGTSFGISTIHLAAAVRDNRSGHVITTELSAEKIASARATFVEVGLDEHITILEGDARETLGTLEGWVDFLLLDGWKDLCLPILQMLDSQMLPGTLVIADDLHLPALEPYLEYVRDPANGYSSVTFPVEDQMEISCRL